MALPAEQKMFGLTDVVSSIDIMLDDIYRRRRRAAGGRRL